MLDISQVAGEDHEGMQYVFGLVLILSLLVQGCTHVATHDGAKKGSAEFVEMQNPPVGACYQYVDGKCVEPVEGKPSKKSCDTFDGDNNCLAPMIRPNPVGN